MDTKEKIESMIKKKKKGNTFFGMRKYDKACDFYSKALGVFSESDLKKEELKDEEKAEIKKNQASCHSNTALCKLKLKQFADCIESCDKALEIEPENVKAIYRRGQAHAYNGNNPSALVDLKEAAKLSPEDKQIAKMVEVIKKRLRLEKKKEKDLYRGMFEKMTLAKGKNAGYAEAEGDSSSSSSSSSDDSSESDDDDDDDDKKDEKVEAKKEEEPKKEEKVEPKKEEAPKKEEKVESKKAEEPKKEEKVESKKEEEPKKEEKVEAKKAAKKKKPAKKKKATSAAAKSES